jgi:PucR family transcriptional regulator, proline-responsive transcriptional activator
MICREILKLPSLNRLEAVAGTDGMERLVRWVYVAECFDNTFEIVDWLFGGELVFITGRGIKGDEQILLELIEKINEKNVSGLIINVGPYILEIPQTAIDLANKLNFPLFKLPWEIKLVEITHDLSSAIILKEMEEKSLDNLLENILFSEVNYDENLIDRAAYYGFDLSTNCQVSIIDIDGFADFLKKHEIKDEKKIIDLKISLKRIVQDILVCNGKKALMMLRSDSIILLSKSQEIEIKVFRNIFNEIKIEVARKLKGMTISAGVGNAYLDLKDMKKSLKEAEMALKIAKFSNSINNICAYNDLGIYSLLLNIKDYQILDKFYYDCLGSIIEYDKLNSKELINTLEMLLKESGNISLTSEKLYIHRNTLKYRIQKIEEITNSDLRNLKDCIKMEIAIMIGSLMKENRI